MINRHQIRRSRVAAVALLLAVSSVVSPALAPRAIAADPETSPARGVAEHVVVVIMDGLRPDSVTLEDMPTLYKLGHDGVNFTHHHPVYLSSTEVNGTAISTGSYPSHSGIMANSEYRPQVELLKAVGTEKESLIRKSDKLTNGQYLKMPTVAEILQQNGMKTLVAGTKPVALLLDRSEHTSDSSKGSADVFQGKSVPAGLLDSGPTTQEAFPALADAKKSANAEEDAWTTRLLVKRLWNGSVPPFTTLWLSEPDYAQHGSGPGSDVAKSALKSSDDNLAVILKGLDDAGVRDKTDVIVVSDHGFSTISRCVDLPALLVANGFDAAAEFKEAPKKGQVLVVGQGGSVCLYVIDRDQDVTRRLTEFLQTSDFASVIFSRSELPGTFPLSATHIDTETGPDIVFATRWSDDKSATGLPGTLVSEGLKRTPGMGNHAGLGKYDMHNSLFASGPDFKTAFADDLPTGNIDVAPTVLWLLGVSQKGMDGRVLVEALKNSPTPAPVAQPETLEVHRDLKGVTWTQTLKTQKVASSTYYDEGNGGAAPSPAAAR